MYPSCNVPNLVTGKLSAMTQDERAHKYTTGALGSGGHKICGVCSNCINFKSSWLPDGTGFYQPSTSIDPNDFVEYTGADMRRMQQRLKELSETVSPTRLAQFEQMFGYHYSPHSFLQDEHLMSIINVPDAWEWDIMHCMFIKGLATNEATACLRYLAKFDMGPKQFDEYLHIWTWPKEYSDAKKCVRMGR